MRKLVMTVLTAAVTSGVLAASQCKPTDLRCDYQVNPLSVDSARPILSWKLDDARTGARQTAYHVMVASTKERLSSGKADLWDSGKTDSDQSVGVIYAGPELKSRQKCFWQVRVWDKDGT